MAVNNTLVQKNDNKQVEYTAGNETVRLTPNMIRNYLVSGDASKITDQEIVMFLNLCRFQHLNPFLREAYLVKYGSEPATIVTGKDAFMKRAQRNERFQGFEAGVVVQQEDSPGNIEYRAGSLVLSGEKIVGGWAKVHISGHNVPIESTVSFDEYVGKKSNGEINRQWATKPATMIRKVALVQALREAFPEDFSGMYSQEEMGIDGAILSDVPVEILNDEPRAIAEPVPEAGNDPLAE